MLNWRKLSEEKPEDGQECLTIMKHGIISGFYDEKGNYFDEYYWREMSWFATHWVPVEEVVGEEGHYALYRST